MKQILMVWLFRKSGYDASSLMSVLEKLQILKERKTKECHL